jgi:hypothetical protein
MNIFLDKDYFPEHEEQRADAPGCLTRESIERAKQGKRVGVGRTKSIQIAPSAGRPQGLPLRQTVCARTKPT